MTPDASFWTFISEAGPTVKFVMLLLVMGSVLSWAVIFQRGFLFKRSRRSANKFEQHFWSGVDVNELFNDMKSRRDSLDGLESVFYAGFEAFLRMRQNPSATPAAMMESVQRAMRVAQSRERDRLEQHLGFLATVGSVSPYVGLFGTVWGIMTALRSLAHVEQATIAVVAPGISETLIATAMGLFAAIPAYIAYNRYAVDLERLSNQYENFQEEFYTILHRQAYSA